MNPQNQPAPPHGDDGKHRDGRPAPSLAEWVTAALLLAVIGALGWMIVVAYQPTWLRFGSVEAEVILVVVLLSAALGMVSWVALRHPR